MKTLRPATLLITTLAGVLGALVLFSPIERHADNAPEPRDLLRSTLKRLATAEEVYAAETGTFVHPDSLRTLALPDGIRLASWTSDSASWQATLVHPASRTRCTQRAGPERLEAAVCAER